MNIASNSGKKRTRDKGTSPQVAEPQLRYHCFRRSLCDERPRLCAGCHGTRGGKRQRDRRHRFAHPARSARPDSVITLDQDSLAQTGLSAVVIISSVFPAPVVVSTRRSTTAAISAIRWMVAASARVRRKSTCVSFSQADACPCRRPALRFRHQRQRHVLATADLNTIPANSIERIEVLQAGASALYGSDADGVVISSPSHNRKGCAPRRNMASI